VYSLVSASVLAMDLARHPSGAAVADTTDRVLALSADDLHLLAEAAAPLPARDDVRHRVLVVCAQAPRMSTLMGEVRRATERGLPGPVPARTIARTLGQTLLGGLGDLQDLLRREHPLCAPGTPAEGRQAALDAVAVAWAARLPDVDLQELALLRAPWAAVHGPRPPAALPDGAYGGQERRLGTLLEQLARVDDEAWRRVERASWAERAGMRWSSAMHEACRVATDSGRLVPVARAQLAAARAMRLSGVSTTTSASGAMLAVTAAVQATCVLDLLDPATATTLLAPWGAATKEA
jgi:hypothetical protein